MNYKKNLLNEFHEKQWQDKRVNFSGLKRSVCKFGKVVSIPVKKSSAINELRKDEFLSREHKDRDLTLPSSELIFNSRLMKNSKESRNRSDMTADKGSMARVSTVSYNSSELFQNIH